MIVHSPTKILQNPVQDPTSDLTGTYMMTVLRPTKILQNAVQDDHPIGWLYLDLPRSYKILYSIMLKILREPIRWLYVNLSRSYKILSNILLKILQEPIGTYILSPTKILQNPVQDAA